LAQSADVSNTNPALEFTQREANLTVKKPGPSKIFIIDDHPVVAIGLAKLFADEPDLEVCGSARSAEEIPDSFTSAPPDLFMVEIMLHAADGLQVLTRLAERYPRAEILVYSARDESFYAERVLQSGAKGYIMKSESPERVVIAARRVLRGDFYISSRLQSLLFSNMDSETSGFVNPVRKLSNRELQVLQLIGQGKSNREISSILDIRLKTVEAHRFRIREKLNLKHSTELTQFAIHMVEREGVSS